MVRFLPNYPVRANRCDRGAPNDELGDCRKSRHCALLAWRQTLKVSTDDPQTSWGRGFGGIAGISGCVLMLAAKLRMCLNHQKFHLADRVEAVAELAKDISAGVISTRCFCRGATAGRSADRPPRTSGVARRGSYRSGNTSSPYRAVHCCSHNLVVKRQ